MTVSKPELMSTVATNMKFGLDNTNSNALSLYRKKNTSSSNALLDAVPKAAAEISNISTNRYVPIWTKIDSSSDYLSAMKKNKNIAKLEFGIDVYRHGKETRSFDVACYMTMAENDSASSCPYPHPGDSLVIRSAHGLQWVGSQGLNIASSQLNLNLLDLLKKLVTDAAQIPVLLPESKPEVDPRLSAKAKAALIDLLNRWNDGDFDGPDELSEALQQSLQKAPFADGIKSFWRERKADAEFTACLFRAISDVASSQSITEFKEFLLSCTISSKSSVRYAAIEALSYHIDSETKEILNIRLKTEKNRSVAALIAASLD